MHDIDKRIAEIQSKLLLSAQWGVDEDISTLEKELKILQQRKAWLEDDGA